MEIALLSERDAQITKSLRKADLAYQVARDEREFWRLEERLRPDLVMIDLAMPAVDGYQLLAEIKSQRPGQPVMLVTSGEELAEGSLERAVGDPTVDFVTSRIGAHELRLRLHRLLGAGAAKAPRGIRKSPAFGLSSYLVRELHHPGSGRIDAARVGAMFGLSLAELARILGKKPSTLYKTPDAPSSQHGLATFERMAAALLRLVGSPEGLRVWLNAPNPELGGLVPMSLIREGRLEPVLDLLEDALYGQPG